MNRLCAHCQSPSGTKLICDGCLRSVLSNDYLRAKYDRMLQQIACAEAGWICSYCGGDFSAEDLRCLVCMDHVKTKGAYPLLRYDFSNLRCTCGAGGKDCHTKRGEGRRRADLSTAENIKIASQPRARRATCSFHSCALLPIGSGPSTDRCVRHQRPLPSPPTS